MAFYEAIMSAFRTDLDGLKNLTAYVLNLFFLKNIYKNKLLCCILLCKPQGGAVWNRSQIDNL
jgi:hypothetical protein